MKAAVLKEYDTVPAYEETEIPALKNQDTKLIEVLAAPLKNFDRLQTIQSFYASFPELPAIVGSDGVGVTQDGERIYAFGQSGMLAEKALVSKITFTRVPEGLEDTLAAALPNAVMGAIMPLQLKGKVKKGDVVLVNGATGFTGRLAVQAAKLLGAKKVIATGRNAQRLDYLKTLGADETLSLTDSELEISKRMEDLQRETPVDIVLDYLWGPAGSLFLDILAKGAPHPTRFVNMGNSSGSVIHLNANTIRSSAVEIYGAGVGSYTKAEFGLLFDKFIPAAYQWAVEGKIKMEVEVESLAKIGQAWNRNGTPGKRLVFKIK